MKIGETERKSRKEGRKEGINGVNLGMFNKERRTKA